MIADWNKKRKAAERHCGIPQVTSERVRARSIEAAREIPFVGAVQSQRFMSMKKKTKEQHLGVRKKKRSCLPSSHIFAFDRLGVSAVDCFLPLLFVFANLVGPL